MDKIAACIDEFNKYRSPEAHASMLAFDGKRITVKFTGHFCKSCGFHDYFDDLNIIFTDNAVKTSIGKVQEMEDGAVVEFLFENEKSNQMRPESQA